MRRDGPARSAACFLAGSALGLAVWLALPVWLRGVAIIAVALR